ncbi:unnamed protein product [Urochloa humidicola]
MESGSSRRGLLQHTAFPCASDSSVSSPSRATTFAEAAGGAGKEEAVETAHFHRRRRLSAVDKGDGLHPAALGPRRVLFPSSAAEIEEVPPPPPSRLLALGKQKADDADLTEVQQLRGGLDDAVRSPSMCRQGGEPRPEDEARWCAGAGAPRRPLGLSAASEIEEVPHSPPPPSRGLIAANAAAAAAGPAGMTGELERKRAAVLAAMASRRLQQLCPDGEPRRQEAGGAASIEMLEGEAGTMRDRMLRLQQEELQALGESLHAWEEFWKPVPVHQRKNSKIGGTCNWIRIISGIAFASGIAICWKLFGESRTTKGFCRHVAQFMCVSFLLLVLYSIYLISRLVLV